MKANKILIIFLVFQFGCNDEFMERYPLDTISDQNFWHSETDLQLYCNSFYGIYFEGFDNNPYTVKTPYGYQGSAIPYGDIHSDNSVPRDYSIVGMLSGIYVKPSGAGSGGWNWNNIRALNYFLVNYYKADIALNKKKIYAGEILFFKTIDYFEKIKLFGEVPWYNKPLETNSDEIYNARTPRDELMDSVLFIINKSIEWLPEKGKEDNGRVNRDMALLLKARVCLFEGTFRKYHTEIGLAGEKFLEEAKGATDQLIGSGNYSIWSTGDPNNDYHNFFIQNDYKNNPEIILWKKYLSGLLMNAFLRNFVWTQSYNYVGLSKSLVDEYLCTDGLPISSSLEYLGDDSIQSQMKFRDPRLRQTVCNPGEYTLDPKNTISFTNRGTGYNTKMPPIGGTGDEAPSPTGYWPIKFWKYDANDIGVIGTGIMPCPIYRYAEVLLINAEANAELGTCTQVVLDNTINKLRDRVKMPHLKLTSIPLDSRMDANYSNYCGYVPSPLIREIRRERRVELVMENFRWDDLCRWKAGKLLIAPQAITGMKFNQYQYPSVKVGTDIYLDNDGYLYPYKLSLPNGRTFNEPKQYYFPIPQEEIVMNPNLKQNSGWE